LGGTGGQQDTPFPPECFELPQAFNEDLFAPLLFHGFPQPYVNNFDPPFFLDTSSVHHGAQSGKGNVKIPVDITDPFFDSESHFE
jgi:hypothetical protein